MDDETESRSFPARVAVDADGNLRVIDLGMETTQVRRVKLAGANAPEMNDPDPLVREAAQASRDAVLFWLSQIAVEIEWPLIVTTHGERPDEGSWWADVVDAAGRDLAADLIASGHADPSC
jgi:endonuclease YncB( thermonuclease family)